MAQVRSDGLYGWRGDGYTTYLRFYADGEVISESSTGTPKEVARWMSRKRSQPGKWTVSGDEIAFVFHIRREERGQVLEEGDISYRGRIDGERLNLHVTSDLTELSRDKAFDFVAVTFGENA